MASDSSSLLFATEGEPLIDADELFARYPADAVCQSYGQGPFNGDIGDSEAIQQSNDCSTCERRFWSSFGRRVLPAVILFAVMIALAAGSGRFPGQLARSVEAVDEERQLDGVVDLVGKKTGDQKKIKKVKCGISLAAAVYRMANVATNIAGASGQNCEELLTKIEYDAADYRKQAICLDIILGAIYNMLFVITTLSSAVQQCSPVEEPVAACLAQVSSMVANVLVLIGSSDAVTITCGDYFRDMITGEPPADLQDLDLVRRRLTELSERYGNASIVDAHRRMMTEGAIPSTITKDNAWQLGIAQLVAEDSRHENAGSEDAEVQQGSSSSEAKANVRHESSVDAQHSKDAARLLPFDKLKAPPMNYSESLRDMLEARPDINRKILSGFRCWIGSGQTIAFLMNIGLGIVAAIDTCEPYAVAVKGPKQSRKCASKIMGIIGSAFLATRFLCGGIVACQDTRASVNLPPELSLDRIRCAADIAGVGAGVFASVSPALGLVDTCNKLIDERENPSKKGSKSKK